MACFHPLKAFVTVAASSEGKRQLFFRRPTGGLFKSVDLPCGQCIGCRLERSRQWAMRCMHEASLYECNAFVTLTYDDEHLPDFGSLDVRHFQLFMKRLRKKFGKGVRYYACGEYGEKLSRPHFHACLFNINFSDCCAIGGDDDFVLYRSSVLDALWGMGFASIGELTFESAAYVARYCTKKVSGKAAEQHYQRVCPETGECYSVKPEFALMSRRPGIGAGWYELFGSEVFPHDEVIFRGRPMKPPQYYDRLHAKASVLAQGDVRRARQREARKHSANNTPERLRVRERVTEAKASRVGRSYEG